MALLDLHTHLQRRSWACAAVDLAPLRAAAAALLQEGVSGHAGAPSDAPSDAHLDGSIELLAAALLSPPEALFADVNGVPRRPDGALSARALHRMGAAPSSTAIALDMRCVAQTRWIRNADPCAKEQAAHPCACLRPHTSAQTAWVPTGR